MKSIFPILLLSSVLFTATQTIAISYFDNTSGLEEYNPLSKGLADMLITDLSNVKSIQIVEREKLETLLKEIDLGESKFMDESTAQKLGKGLGAEYMLTGSYLIMGETMRIDARLVDVATGEVYMGEEITGQKSTFFELEKQLVEKLIATLNLELSRTEKRNLSKVQTESFDSFNAYSSALVAYDDGNIEESIKYLEKATEADEAFDKAWEKLEILEQRLTDLLKARELGMGPMLIDLIDRVSNKDKESLSELITTCGSLMTTYTGIALGWYGENSETLNKNDKFDEANINETLKQEIERVNNKFYSKYFQAINFYKQVIDIAKSNGLLYEKWYASTVEEILYFYYIMALSQSNTLFINYHDTYYGIPEAIPNIVDSNGKIIVKSENINKILIKIGTEMMEKYPVGIYFTTFKIYVEDAIKNEKKKREK